MRKTYDKPVDRIEPRYDPSVLIAVLAVIAFLIYFVSVSGNGGAVPGGSTDRLGRTMADR